MLSRWLRPQEHNKYCREKDRNDKSQIAWHIATSLRNINYWDSLGRLCQVSDVSANLSQGSDFPPLSASFSLTRLRNLSSGTNTFAEWLSANFTLVALMRC